MKRILLITLEYPPDIGGVASYLEGFWNALPHEMRGAVSRTHIRRPFAWVLMAPWIFLHAMAARTGIMAVSHVLPMGYIAWLFKGLCGWPYIVFVHGTDLKTAQATARKRKWAERILRDAAFVVANSSYARDLAIKLYRVIPAKIEIAHPCPKPVTASGVERSVVPTLLSVARLVPRKGLDRVIRLMPKLKEEFPNVRCVIVGGGPEEKSLKELAERLSVAVAFKGRLKDEELAKEYDAANVFILPGTETGDDVEGFGLVYLEAAAHGLPSVASDTGGVREAVIDRKTGLIVDAADTEALRRAVVSLLQDPDLARRYGEAGRQRVQEEFTWAKQAERVIGRLKAL